MEPVEPMKPIEDDNNYLSLKNNVKNLFYSKKHSDCLFLVGQPPNHHAFKAHRLVLSVCSPVFHTMFFGSLPEKDFIYISDVEPQAFYALLKCIYTDEVDLSTFDNACDLYYAAHKYMIPYINSQCVTFLTSRLSIKNACRAYELANFFEDFFLMQNSMKYIVNRTFEVINDPSFMDIEVNTLMNIFNNHCLCISSELELIDCLLKFSNKGENEGNREESRDTDESSISAVDDDDVDDNDDDGDGDGDGDSAVENNDQLTIFDRVALKIPFDFNQQLLSELANANESNVPVGNDPTLTTFDRCCIDIATYLEQRDNLKQINGDADDSEDAADSFEDMGLWKYSKLKRILVDENILRNALKLIRFLSLTKREFSLALLKCKLLLKEETPAVCKFVSDQMKFDIVMSEKLKESRELNRCSMKSFTIFGSHNCLPKFNGYYTAVTLKTNKDIYILSIKVRSRADYNRFDKKMISAEIDKAYDRNNHSQINEKYTHSTMDCNFFPNVELIFDDTVPVCKNISYRFRIRSIWNLDMDLFEFNENVNGHNGVTFQFLPDQKNVIHEITYTPYKNHLLSLRKVFE